MNMQPMFDKIAAKCPDGEVLCPVCKHNNWGAAEDLMKLQAKSKSWRHPTPIYTCVVAVCNNCGNTLLFSADKLGLLD